MPALTRKKAGVDEVVEYRGKQTKTGNSLGFRFEGALFKSHPEFKGEVKAHVISPGRMLVIAEPKVREKSDPILAAFLALLSEDMAQSPEQIRPLDEALVEEMHRLTRGVVVSPEDDLGDEDIL